jgi:hypothetical protein
MVEAMVEKKDTNDRIFSFTVLLRDFTRKEGQRIIEKRKGKKKLTIDRLPGTDELARANRVE